MVELGRDLDFVQKPLSAHHRAQLSVGAAVSGSTEASWRRETMALRGGQPHGKAAG